MFFENFLFSLSNNVLYSFIEQITPVELGRDSDQNLLDVMVYSLCSMPLGIPSTNFKDLIKLLSLVGQGVNREIPLVPFSLHCIYKTISAFSDYLIERNDVLKSKYSLLADGGKTKEYEKMKSEIEEVSNCASMNADMMSNLVFNMMKSMKGGLSSSPVGGKEKDSAASASDYILKVCFYRVVSNGIRGHVRIYILTFLYFFFLLVGPGGSG